MKYYLSINLQCSLILYALCFASLGCYAGILELDEGDVCNKGSDDSSDSVCKRIKNCMVVGDEIQNKIRPQICSFIGEVPVVCCPPNRWNTRPNPPTPRPYLPTPILYPPTPSPNSPSSLLHPLNTPTKIGDVCSESSNGFSDSVCRLTENCMIDGRAIRHEDNLPICSFIGEVPVVCCPPNRWNTRPNSPTPRPYLPTPRPYPPTPSPNSPSPPLHPLNTPAEIGDVCSESSDGFSDSVCRLTENCMIDGRAIRHEDNLPICSFIGEVPVVCCPPNRWNTRPNSPTPRPYLPTPRPYPPTPSPNSPSPPLHPLNTLTKIGDVCSESSDGLSDSICRLTENCMIDGRAIRHEDNLPICSFIGEVPVVCCPPNRWNTRPNSPTPRPYLPTPRPYPPTPSTNSPSPPLHPLNTPTEIGDVCSESSDGFSDSVCRLTENCMIDGRAIRHEDNLPICSFIGEVPVVCCPPSRWNTKPNPPTPPPIPLNIPTSNASYSAEEMCHEYSNLIYTFEIPPTLTMNQNHKTPSKVKPCIERKPLTVGGQNAETMEFPHMVLLGYEQYPVYDYQRCGGSLISTRWVLSAAHCEKLDSTTFVTWARVGELNFKTKIDKDIPKDYRVVQRVIHPNYNGAVSSYDDIALFRLEQDVVFSLYVRPICLNTNQALSPHKFLASGWGSLNYDEELIQPLQKVVIENIPVKHCKSLYSNDARFPRGLNKTSMLCAGNLKGGKETCAGDSGGPLQIYNAKYGCMYTQVGITSIGSIFCGTQDTYGVYTRISNYISWIEPIVWPKNQ